MYTCRVIREHLFDKRAATDPLFRWRGGDVSRIEGISDGVFAVTLTLLVAANSPPTTFWGLWLLVRDLPAFLMTFVLLKQAWYYHYLFFRRYGLQDTGTIALNAALLFLVLFFAFPLKFMADYLWHIVIGLPLRPLFELPPEAAQDGHWLADPNLQAVAMMIFYGAGVIGLFGVIALLLWRAWGKRDELELDRLERHLTIASLLRQTGTMCVGILSLLLLAITGHLGPSGWIYFIVGPWHLVIDWWSARRVRSLRDGYEWVG